MENKFEIDISDPKRLFVEHLNLESNDRIIFSGIFGIGKTYFLQNFFDPGRYNVFHIFPVNYSVSSNEDIFELIKYDIFYELLGYKIDYKNITVSVLDSIFYFSTDNLDKLIAPFLRLIPLIGKKASKAIPGILKLIDNISQYRSELKKNDSQEALNYLRKFENKQGTIYENDIYTELISKILEEICRIPDTESEKQNVLIIDDLDRIDPEHIFRLLNIFAAQLDNDDQSQKNKFGFDKVIFVLDIDNVRNIFHNRYGSDADFSGYIDKFYCYDVFDFNNTSAISQSVNNIITSIKTDEQLYKVFSFQPGTEIGIVIIDLLVLMINCNAINLRVLLKLYNKYYTIPNYVINFEKHISQQNRNLPPVLVYDFLKYIFGSHDGLINAIIKCLNKANEINVDDSLKWEIGNLLLIIDSKNHKFNEGVNTQEPYVYINPDLDIKISYTLRKHGAWHTQNAINILNIFDIKNNEISLSDRHFFSLLKLTFLKINTLQTNSV